MRVGPLAVALLLGLLGTHCSSSDPAPPAGVEALFVAPESLDALSGPAWLDHPWPSDVRREADGSVRLKGFYNPRQTVLVETYIKRMSGVLRGFSPAASGYLRFTGDLDPASLPADPKATLDPSSSVQLVDVDPKSPERGKRRLAQLEWRKDDGVYWMRDTLAVSPALGYPLRPATRYAIVVTRAARSATGAALRPSADLEEVLGLRAPSARTQAVRDVYAPAVAELSSAGVAPGDVAHLAVFTTDDPTAELYAVVDHVKSSYAAPTFRADQWKVLDTRNAYDLYEGWYGPSPNYQAGKLPFTQDGDGGRFAFEGGQPKVQSEFDVRYSLVVPNATRCPMPADGYPLVLFANGTGADSRDVVAGAPGDELAGACLATVSIDQIFHGLRPGAPPAGAPNREADIELLFFNLNNVESARTSARQSAVDMVQLARLFTVTKGTVPASVSKSGQEVRFDPKKIVFFGHSQGGLTGPLFLAADDAALGGVLSGAGSMITVALLEKTLPEPSVARVVKTLLQVVRAEDEGELGPLHPALALAQTLVDPVDPVNYAAAITARPRGAGRPKSIFVTEGVNPDGSGDSYAPPHGIELHAVALGVPRMLPGVRPVPELFLGGPGDVALPPGGLSGNIAGGRATGVLGQYVPPAGIDGHYVAFYVGAAQKQYLEFCKTLARDGIARVSAP